MDQAVLNWLRDHDKGDLQECSWAEIKEAFAAARKTCPIAEGGEAQ